MLQTSSWFVNTIYRYENMARYKQGTYKVKNTSKYLGTSNPRYLSSYELRVFNYLDNSPHVLKWGAEIIIVPYYSPADESNRRYMVDIYAEYRKPSGEVVKEIIEIKPTKDTIQPKKTRGKKQRTYLREVYTYNVNIAKWIAATAYAKARGWTFRLLTEKDIFK